VIATDLSESALAVARRNLDLAQPRTPVEIRHGSLLEPIGLSECDVLVSNPPYLSSAEYQRLDPEVRDYEPRSAFDGGADGLDHYRALLSRAGTHLLAGGLLALEIDSRRSEIVLALALAAGWSDARIAHDVFDRPRYLLATNLEGTT
jgi:release factor glutamine methyltransferase